MTDTQAMPAEALARIIYETDLAGAPIRIEADGSTDGSVYLMTGNKTMNSATGPTTATEAAIATDCYTREAVETVSGATSTWQDCPAAGAMSLYSKLLTGWEAGHDAAGLVQNLEIESAAGGSCETWLTSVSATRSFAAMELVGWRYCDNAQEMVRANVFRKITQAVPSAQLQAGLLNPGTATSGNINLTLASNPGWGDGPGGLIPTYELDGTTSRTGPYGFGIPIGTPALYETLISLCACNNGVRGVPLTAALVAANPELQTDFIRVP